MGGNAFEDLDRISLEVYQQLEGGLLGDNFCLRSIPQLGSKTDFGDMDILCPNHVHPIQDLKIDSFLAVKKNGRVYSFLLFYMDYKFQLDVITIPPEKMECARFYFSYGDFGNLMGRLVQRQSLSFGDAGLFYRYKDSRQRHHKFLITDDVKEICNILGLDLRRINNGIYDNQDLIHLISDSPYFSPEILTYSRNHKHRNRLKKRKIYQDLPSLLSCYGAREVKVYDFFPQFSERINEIEEGIKRSEEFRSKFPPHRVSELVKLEGKELGKFYSILKQYKDFPFDRAIELTRERFF